ncbi:MAG: hypothetical protein M1837_002517 [Sclerophora amabilis]|nr:MAG: hypothetical protein M1837_002517 [Sclerophora amabilis]
MIPTPPLLSSSQLQEIDNHLNEQRRAAEVLAAAKYGDFNPQENRWLNITGFGADEGYEWTGLQRAKQKALIDLSDLLGTEGTKLLEGRLPTIRGKEQVDKAQLRNRTEEEVRIPFYGNVTGRIQGQWVRSELSEGLRATAHLTRPNGNNTGILADPDLVTPEYHRNITGSSGGITINLDERLGNKISYHGGHAKEISARMTIKDEMSSGDGWEMNLFGVHFEELGGLILSTTSSKFAGTFGLPHFSLSEHTYDITRRLLNNTISPLLHNGDSVYHTPIEDMWPSPAGELPYSPTPTQNCEYIVYLQQYPIERSNFYSSEVVKSVEDPGMLRLIEKELRFPTGASLPKAPLITMTMTIFSPDCGFILESKGPPAYLARDGLHLQGQKLEIYLSLAKRHALLFAVICAFQLILLVRQMKAAVSPSTVSRISLNTIAMMALGDGFAWVGSMGLGLFVDSAYLILIPTSFFAFMCVSLFGMKLLINIWIVQAPERRERERQRAAAIPSARNQDETQPYDSSVPSVMVTPAGAEALPLPATARRPDTSGATPVILPPDQDLDAAAAEDDAAINTTTPNTADNGVQSFGALYTRFYFLLLALILLSILATSWSTTIRSSYTNCLTIVYFSFWVPQIHRNIMRNCRKALRWEFVIGQSLLRLLPFYYIYTVPNNILFVEPDSDVAYALVAWVWIQLWALASQAFLGPRFFVPKGWAPPAYDYHPVLREADLEAGGGTSMPRGFTRAPSPSQQSTTGTGSAATDSGKMAGGSRNSADKARRTFTCGVCLQDLEIGSGDGVLERRSYMLTPCGHIYHSDCLKAWIDIRLVCPLCKEDLPPY